MGKRLIGMFLVGVISIVFLLVISVTWNQREKEYVEGEDVKFTSLVLKENEVAGYLKASFSASNSGKTILSVEKSSEKKLKTNNNSQEKLSAFYNSNLSGGDHKVPDNQGTCWAAAITDVTEYMKYKGSTNASFCNSVYRYTLNNAVLRGYINMFYYGGLPSWCQDPLLECVLSRFVIQRDCTNVRTAVFDKLKSKIDLGTPTLFTIPHHVMCGCGYAYYKLKYILDTGSGHTQVITVTYPFVVVNSTWATYGRYSYYPKQEIGGDGIANVFTDEGWIVTVIQ